MSEESPDPTPDEVRAQAARRRRLAEIFGDVLPEQTGDDSEPATRRETPEEQARVDDWLRRQVPPHHGGH